MEKLGRSWDCPSCRHTSRRERTKDVGIPIKWAFQLSLLLMSGQRVIDFNAPS